MNKSNRLILSILTVSSLMVLNANAEDFIIPALPDGQKSEQIETPEAQNQKEQTGEIVEHSSNKKLSSAKSTPTKALSEKPKTVEGSPIRNVAKKINAINSRQPTAHRQMPPTPPVYTPARYTEPQYIEKDKTSEISPIMVTSSKETHVLNGAGLYQNTIVMKEPIEQIFSSKKISVEIRGPIAIMRFPQMAGSEVDIQIVTKRLTVETFIFKVDNTLPAQKFIITGKDDNPEGELNQPDKPHVTRGNSALDVLAIIANGKKPAGYKKLAVKHERREFNGIGVRELAGYGQARRKFIIYSITNETSKPVGIHEWDLDNSIVLGSRQMVKAVKMMSLDKRTLKPGETTIMYVGFATSGGNHGE